MQEPQPRGTHLAGLPCPDFPLQDVPARNGELANIHSVPILHGQGVCLAIHQGSFHDGILVGALGRPGYGSSIGITQLLTVQALKALRRGALIT